MVHVILDVNNSSREQRLGFVPIVLLILWKIAAFPSSGVQGIVILFLQ